jgi:hypothetical protein
MNLLFCASPNNVYTFLTKEAYPTSFAPFPAMVPDVPNFLTCNDKNNAPPPKRHMPLQRKC